MIVAAGLGVALTRREDVDDDVVPNGRPRTAPGGRRPPPLATPSVKTRGPLRIFPDHLPVAVVGPGKLAPHASPAPSGSTQSLNGARRCGARRACAPAPAGNATDRRSSGRARNSADVLRHNAPVLADHDAIGVGVDFDRAADRRWRSPRYLLLS